MEEDSRKKILIVDDDEGLSQIFSEMLSDAGYEGIVANCCSDALDWLAGNRVDCMLLDITLAGESAFELIKKLNQSEIEIPPFLIVSGHQDPDFLEGIEKTGASGFVLKDQYIFETLPLAIERLLDK